MDKLKMHSVNKVDENVAKIGKLFPNCVTERRSDNGEVEYAVDFDMLRQELSSVVVEGNEERYQFTWPDKKKAILAANAPISATLRPCREMSEATSSLTSFTASVTSMRAECMLDMNSLNADCILDGWRRRLSALGFMTILMPFSRMDMSRSASAMIGSPS